MYTRSILRTKFILTFRVARPNFLSEGVRCGLDKEIAPDRTYLEYFLFGAMIERSQMTPYHKKLSFGFVKSLIRSSRHLLQLILNEIFAKRHKVVGKYKTLNMVVLVLDNTRRLTCELLVVLHEVLIEVAHTDRYRATHILV